MAIPWWTQYGPLGHPDVEAHVERETHRAWWRGFWWGALLGISWTALAFAVDIWLKH